MTLAPDLRPLADVAVIESERTAPQAVFRSGDGPAERTLLDILGETTSRHPHAPAIDAGGKVLSYRRLADEVDTLPRRLTAAGIGVGDRVGIRISSVPRCGRCRWRRWCTSPATRRSCSSRCAC